MAQSVLLVPEHVVCYRQWYIHFQEYFAGKNKAPKTRWAKYKTSPKTKINRAMKNFPLYFKKMVMFLYSVSKVLHILTFAGLTHKCRIRDSLDQIFFMHLLKNTLIPLFYSIIYIWIISVYLFLFRRSQN